MENQSPEFLERVLHCTSVGLSLFTIYNQVIGENRLAQGLGGVDEYPEPINAPDVATVAGYLNHAKKLIGDNRSWRDAFDLGKKRYASEYLKFERALDQMAALSIDDEFNLLKKGYPAKPMLSMLYIKMGEGMTKRQALEYLAFSHTEMFSQYVSAIHVHAQHEDF